MICMGLKTVENKAVPFPGTLPLPCTLAVHASSNGESIAEDIDEMLDDDRFCDSFDSPDCKPCVPGHDYFYRSTIIGLIDVVACFDATRSSDIESDLEQFGFPNDKYEDNSYHEWANGPYCLILKNPRRFRTGIMARGQLNYWKLTPEVQQLVIDHSSDLLEGNAMPTAPINGVPRCVGRPKKVSA